VAAALVFGSVAPAAALAMDDVGPACCHGRCCCGGPARTVDTCVRSACHCGGERGELLSTVPLPDVVLTLSAGVDPLASVGAEAVPEGGRAPTPALSVPHPPPRLEAPGPSAV
jgi:hypothetical protein